MFETMQSFLVFFIPTLALIISGIIFEEKLVAFEQKIKAAVLKKQGKSPVNTKGQKNLALSSASAGKAPSRHGKGRAA